jgi:hypothetical protein
MEKYVPYTYDTEGDWGKGEAGNAPDLRMQTSLG